MAGFRTLSLRWKELQNKENPCKLILYGDFLFLAHSKNKYIKAFLDQRKNLRDFISMHIIFVQFLIERVSKCFIFYPSELCPERFDFSIE